MKFLLSISLVVAFAAAALADIQAPPMSDQGPVRKLGRGLSNILYGITELPCSMAIVNNLEGNSAAGGYGVVLGLQRSFYRFGKGWYDFVSFPLPSYNESYRPPYPSNLIWGQHGYAEFPPELGFETRFDYSREYQGY